MKVKHSKYIKRNPIIAPISASQENRDKLRKIVEDIANAAPDIAKHANSLGRNLRGEPLLTTFQECLDELKDNIMMENFFKNKHNISIELTDILVQKGVINTDILDLIVTIYLEQNQRHDLSGLDLESIKSEADFIALLK